MVSRMLVRFREPAMRRRALTMVDQAATTLSNVLITIIAARALGRQEFGAFSLAVVAYQLVGMGSRALIGEPLITLYSHRDRRERRSVRGEVLGSAIFLGVVCAAVTAAIAMAMGGLSGAALLAFAFWLPVMLLEDAWRYVFVSLERPGAAVAVDTAWLVVTVAVALAVPVDPSAEWFVATWGIGAAAGAVVGIALGWDQSTRPHPWRWIIRHRETNSRFFSEFLAIQAGNNLAVVCAGVLAGLPAVGAIRAAQTFYGPLNTLYGGLHLVVVPEGARKRERPDALRKMLVIVSIGLLVIAAAWMLVGLALPRSWGQEIYGRTWTDARDLLLPMGLASTFGCVLSGAFFGLRALGDARRSLAARLRAAPAGVGLPIIGAALGQAPGFAWGWAMGRAGEATVWWMMFHRSLADHERGLEPPLVPLEVLDDDLLATIEIEVIR